MSINISNRRIIMTPALASGGAAAPTFVAGAAVAEQHPNFAVGPYSASGLNGGVNFPSGAVIVVALGDNSSGPGTTNTVVIGGSLTLTELVTTGQARLGVWYGLATSSLTDSISVTSSAAWSDFGVVSCYMTGVQTTPTDFSSESPEAGFASPSSANAAITVPSSGFGVMFYFGQDSGSYIAPTLTNCLNNGGDVNTTSLGGAAAQLGIGHTITAGSWTPTLSPFSFASAIIVGAWGP